MAPSRDRVTIDLRGIGDAVRGHAKAQGVPMATLARQALLDAIGPTSRPITAARPAHRDPRATVKITLRLATTDGERLILNAGALGLSYGDYVARLVNKTPLPARAAQRHADRHALLASTDELAVLAADLHALLHGLRTGRADEVELCRGLVESLDASVRSHLDRASAFLATA